ncbi:MAG: STAS domain-containing protein [Ilumatobacter sp.]
MDEVKLTGSPDAAASFDLARVLDSLTTSIRPAVTVNLSDVEDLHPSVVSVLIRHRRQARRLGGDLRVVLPSCAAAQRTLDHIGLIGAAR